MRPCLPWLLGCLLSINSLAAEVSGLVQASLAVTDNQPGWQEQGSGILRYEEDGLHLQQALVKIDHHLASGWQMELVANLHEDGEQQLGLTQAQLLYKPLSADKVKFRARAGFFYPQMSLENPDTGWLSPYNYTQSAINSWIGEELRIAGLELGLYSPGRQRRSPWSWELYGGVFRGNDTLGTLLSWRGWAMHDRQSLHNDRINFAHYGQPFDTYRNALPAWTEPFKELDGRNGYYAGLHLDYYQTVSVRYYFYDNNADPLAVNEQRLYGWDTRFHSLAASWQLNERNRLISQWVTGDTLMGDNKVYVEFDAWFVLLSHAVEKHRFSARFDRFRTRGDDVWPWDQNHQDGDAITLTWRYQWDESWQFGLEQHINSNRALNRATLGEAPDRDRQQTLALAQYRW